MLTNSRPLALRRMTMILGAGILVLSSITAVSPSVVAKEKYTIDPVTGTKYKPELEMGELLLAFAALGGKPIQTLTPPEARLQPSMADAVDALLKKRGESTDPTKLVPDVTTIEATIPGLDGTPPTAAKDCAAFAAGRTVAAPKKSCVTPSYSLRVTLTFTCFSARPSEVYSPVPSG